MDYMKAMYKCRVCGGDVQVPLTQAQGISMPLLLGELEDHKVSPPPPVVPDATKVHVCLRSVFASKVFEEKLGICDFIGYYGTRAATEEEKKGKIHE